MVRSRTRPRHFVATADGGVCVWRQPNATWLTSIHRPCYSSDPFVFFLLFQLGLHTRYARTIALTSFGWPRQRWRSGTSTRRCIQPCDYGTTYAPFPRPIPIPIHALPISIASHTPASFTVATFTVSSRDVATASITLPGSSHLGFGQPSSALIGHPQGNWTRLVAGQFAATRRRLRACHGGNAGSRYARPFQPRCSEPWSWRLIDIQPATLTSACVMNRKSMRLSLDREFELGLRSRRRLPWLLVTAIATHIRTDVHVYERSRTGTHT